MAIDYTDHPSVQTCDHEWHVEEYDRYHGAGQHTREERTCLACDLAETRVRNSTAYATATGDAWSTWEAYS